MQKSLQIKDRYELPITTLSSQAATYYVDGLDLFLSQNYGSEERFQKATATDERFAIAYGALAILHMYGGRLEKAKDTIKQARSLSVGVSRREQHQIDAITHIIEGEGRRALALIQEHLSEFPRDALMMRLAQRLFVLGCSGAGVKNYPAELFALLKSLASAYGDDWAFLGSYSFANHETGLLTDAFHLAERSLQTRPTNAIASHSIAHVFFERGDHSGGADFLGHWIQSYDSREPYHVHLSWHVALFALAMGHYKEAVNIYETNIRPSVILKSPISLSDSASLMWRLYIYPDSPPPLTWTIVQQQALPAVEGPGPAFRDAHAALAFAGLADNVYMGRLIDRLSVLADKGDVLAADVTLPLVRGIEAFGHGAYTDTIRFMEPIFDPRARMDQLSRIGGSHAQREVFEDTLVAAYLKTENFHKAETILRKRLKRRESARDYFWLGHAQANKGESAAAKVNLSKATKQWQDADHDSHEMSTLKSLVKRTGSLEATRE